jgi:hypothetical protein
VGGTGHKKVCGFVLIEECYSIQTNYRKFATLEIGIPLQFQGDRPKYLSGANVPAANLFLGRSRRAIDEKSELVSKKLDFSLVMSG